MVYFLPELVQRQKTTANTNRNNTVIFNYERNKLREAISKKTASPQEEPSTVFSRIQKRFGLSFKIILDQAFKKFHLEQTSEFKSHKNLTNSTTDCVDPSEHDLLIMLDTLRSTEILLETSSLNESTNPSDISKDSKYDDYNKNLDYKKCNISKSPSFEQRSICPYELVTEKNNGRFPKFLVVAKCKCNICVDKNMSNGRLWSFVCAPVYINMSVLMRDKCGYDGVYEWRYEIQPVARNCGCLPTRIIRPF